MEAQAVTFVLNTDRDSFIAWLENWWSDWRWKNAGLGRIPTETGGYIGVSNLLTEDRKTGAILRKAELFYMAPQQDDPESWVYYDRLRGFEWAIVSLGAERCEVKFTTHDERLLPFYWQALQAVILRWPDVQWIEINPSIEASAPESQPAQSDEAENRNATDPDSIPQWGRHHDLSTHEVREIVRRCKAYQALPGGSIAKFYKQESRQWQYWPDPEEAPRYYSQKTLEGWTRDTRFQ